MLKIAITGPESSGKTSLAKSLSVYYKCPWVPEYAREFLTSRKGLYAQEDLLKILKGQFELESKMSSEKPTYLFCDSDPLLLKIWSEIKYGDVDKEIEKAWLHHSYDFTLLVYPDLEWEYDVLRENEHDRLELFKNYQNNLDQANRPYHIVKGKGDLRLQNALLAIQSQFDS